MVTKVYIKDNSNSPVRYISELDNFKNGTQYTFKEGVSIALTALFNMMFSKNAKLRYDYSQLKETYPLYLDYIDKHKDVRSSEWTILMDEPDRVQDR